jgi:hypothetical protein
MSIRGIFWDFFSTANEYSCAQGVQINFGDLTPYLTYGGAETAA